MIKEFILKAVASSNMPEGKTKLVLDDSQMLDLYNDLYVVLCKPSDETLQAARTFFFEEEGYMANDAKCIGYYHAYK